MKVSTGIILSLILSSPFTNASPTTTVTINSYSCGQYQALLVGAQFSNALSDNPNDTVLMVTGGNLIYTLAQVSPEVAAVANVDFLWQCSAPSASQGCNLAGMMVVNGMNTPNSLSLQVAGNAPINCQENKQAQVPTAINTTDK